MPGKTEHRWSREQSSRFLLHYHNLLTPHSLKGKDDILSYIRKVGCIQFDPLNICGRNPDLVLQSRVRDYRPVLLEELLYKDRVLLDGWDKMMAIYPLEDDRDLSFLREEMSSRYLKHYPDVQDHISDYFEAVRLRGPVSSLEFSDKGKISWAWGSSRLSKAALEYLFFKGDIAIHHREGSRRIYDLWERLLPVRQISELSLEEYQRQHILRRIRAAGIAGFNFRDFWFGIAGTDMKRIRSLVNDLTEEGVLSRLYIGDNKTSWFLHHEAAEAFLQNEATLTQSGDAVILAPLDNMMWNRLLLEEIFNFFYRWEVYTPAAKRQYGYYVLPVLYKEKIIARCEPLLDRKTNKLILKGFWFEEEIKADEEMISALRDMFSRFCRFQGAKRMVTAPTVKKAVRSWFTGITAAK